MPGGGGIIDRFFVALGIQADASGLDEIRQKADEAKASLLGMGDAIVAAISGYAIKQVAALSSEFESNRIAVAGLLSALEISPNFNQGLEDADATLQQIIKDAAALPGEADEYIDVFKAGLPVVREALGADSKLEDITDFTNKITAVAKTINPHLDSGTIGHELETMLSSQGGASKRFPLFRNLMPLMHKLEGQAHLTAQSFNAMTQSKRIDLLKQALVLMQPALDEASHSFDALFGSLKSSVKMFTRLAGKDIFEAMKRGLDRVTGAFVGADGKLTKFGADVVDNIRVVSRWAIQIVSGAARVVVWFAKLQFAGISLKAVLVAVGFALAALAWEKTLGSVLRLVGGVFSLKRAIIGGLLAAFVLIAEDLWQFYHGGESVTGMLVQRFAPAIYLVKGALALIGLQILGLGPLTLLTGAKMLVGWLIGLGPIGLIIAGIAALVVGIYELWTHWDEAVEFMKQHWITFIPLLLSPLGPLFALMAGIKFLSRHWEAAVGSMSKAWKGFTDFFAMAMEVSGIGPLLRSGLLQKVGGGIFAAAGSAFGGGAGLKASAAGIGDIWNSPGFSTPKGAGAVPPGWMAPASLGGNGGGPSNYVETKTTVGTVNIVTNDPATMHEAWQRDVVRDGQSGVAY